MIIGTGCGAGVAFNGRAHIGGNGTAGEWGQKPDRGWTKTNCVIARKTLCYCGKQGCIEPLFQARNSRRIIVV
ncbi:ROK family protein [Shigella sonnei]